MLCHSSKLELRIERYYADLVSQYLEMATVSKMREFRETYDDAYEYAMKSLANASAASKSINLRRQATHTTPKRETLCEENGVSHSGRRFDAI
jgi:hypothetical protein